MISGIFHNQIIAVHPVRITEAINDVRRRELSPYQSKYSGKVFSFPRPIISSPYIHTHIRKGNIASRSSHTCKARRRRRRRLLWRITIFQYGRPTFLERNYEFSPFPAAYSGPQTTHKRGICSSYANPVALNGDKAKFGLDTEYCKNEDAAATNSQARIKTSCNLRNYTR